LVGSSDRDLELVCEDLRKIERDLAFEVAESYEGRRMEDFADTPLALQSIVRVVKELYEERTTFPS